MDVRVWQFKPVLSVGFWVHSFGIYVAVYGKKLSLICRKLQFSDFVCLAVVSQAVVLFSLKPAFLSFSLNK